jgi:ribonucleotide monophosphatase NagD (HAD superfamily)
LLSKYRKGEIVMVGERLSTDRKLAENADSDLVLALSGEATRRYPHGEARQPWRMVETLGDL